MKVKFVPQDLEFEITPNQTVLEIAQKNNIFIKSVCNGVPNCAECRVRVVDGEHNVFPPSGKEKTLIGTAHFIDQRRLSCQLHCFGDITVNLEEQVEKQKSEGSKKRLKAGVRENVMESRAKSGNLIDQDVDLLKEVDNEVGDETLSEDEPSSSALNLEEKDSTSSTNSRGPRNTPRTDGGGQNRNRKRRNKNRNRNPKREAGPDGQKSASSQSNRPNEGAKGAKSHRNGPRRHQQQKGKSNPSQG